MCGIIWSRCAWKVSRRSEEIAKFTECNRLVVTHVIRNKLLDAVQMAIHLFRCHVLVATLSGAFYRASVTVAAFNQSTGGKQAEFLQGFVGWGGNEPVAWNQGFNHTHFPWGSPTAARAWPVAPRE